MKKIHATHIKTLVKNLVLKAAFTLRPDIMRALNGARDTARSARARRTLDVIIENAHIARKKVVPICQDTGLTVVYCDIGQDVHVVGGDFNTAVQNGIADATVAGFLRRSIVQSPLERVNTGTNTPGAIHTRIVSGDTLTFKVLLKGFGCENKGKVCLFNPTASQDEIVDFVAQVIIDAGANACPPFVVGVGLGGALDTACEMAKEVLFRPLHTKNRKKTLNDLEHLIEKRVNKSQIGPLGFGGSPTVLKVLMKEAPTHIAGLPVAVNISCHALRTAEGKL